MIAIDNTLVSEDIIEQHFVCDLNLCKGLCCVEGDSGAPLTKNEAKNIKDNITKIKPFITKKGAEQIRKKGTSILDEENELTTPLVRGKECVYVSFKNGVAMCGIEKAFNQKEINFQKPLSCHLYPIRITSYKNYDAINYHKWKICSPACKCTGLIKIPVFQFVKQALVRKYGKKWFRKLSVIAKKIRQNNII